MSSSGSKNQLRTKSTYSLIGGSRIDVACASFGDRNIVIITEFKKLGTLVSVTPRHSQQGGKPSFNTTVLMGNDNLEHHVFSRAIAEVVYMLSQPTANDGAPTALQGKPLLCTLAVSDTSANRLAEICKLVEQCDVWCKL